MTEDGRRFFRSNPDSISLGKDNRDSRQRFESGKDGVNWIDKLCILLSDGDITKRDEILWDYALSDVKPYIEHCMEKVLFRKAVLGFLGVKKEKEISSDFCYACKKARGVKIEEEDEKCKTCSKEFKVEYLSSRGEH